MTGALRNTEVYPNGKWRAWGSVLGGFLLQFCVIGFMSAFGVMQTYYVRYFLSHSSASAISWIGSVQTLLDLTLGAVVGPLLDRGYLREVVVGGSLIFVFCHFMLSLAKPNQFYQILLSQGLGMGLGIGSIFLPTSVLISQHFKERKALAMGIVPAGGSLGAVVFSISLNYMLNSTLGFASAIRITAFICLALLAAGNMLLSSASPQARAGIHDNGEQQPHATVESDVDTEWQNGTKVEMAGADIGSSTPTVKLWDIDFVLLLIQGFLTGLGLWFPPTYVQLFAEQHGVDQQLAFYSLAILNVSNALGRILPNWLGDRWGALEVYVPCLLFNSGLQFALLGSTTSYGLVLFTTFYGFFSGTAVSLYLPSVASICPEGADVGKRMGIALFPVGIGALIGTPIGGALIGHHYVWWRGILFATVTGLVGTASAACILLRRLRSR